MKPSAPSCDLEALWHVCWFQPLIRSARSLPPCTEKQSISPQAPHPTSHIRLTPLSPSCSSSSLTSLSISEFKRCPGRMQPSWLSSLCFLHFHVSMMQEWDFLPKKIVLLVGCRHEKNWSPFEFRPFMFCASTQGLRRPALQLCPEAQAAPKILKVRGCISCVSFPAYRPVYHFTLWTKLPPASTAGPLKRVFMKQADASNFFRRRSRRGVKSQDELDGEFTLSQFAVIWSLTWSARLCLHGEVCLWSILA